MAKSKVKSAIGIEFTGDRINLVKLAKTAEGVVLVEARSIKSSVGKTEEDKKILAGNVVKVFEGLNFEKDEISLGVGGHISFVRKVKLPPVSRSKLKQVVSFEVQQQVPFSLSEVRWDYQVTSPISKIPGPVIVLIAAVKQSFVEDLIKLLQTSINKTPDIVDTSSLALHNCLIFNDLLPKEKVGILINFGFSYTDVSIENKGEMAFTRAVPIGRKNLLKKIADFRKVDIAKAEEILENEDVSATTLSVWEDLIAEIKRTTNYYLSQVEKVTHFQYLYISGELPKDNRLFDLLKNSFRVEVKEIDPFNKIRHNPEVSANNAGNFCVSTGLALNVLEPFLVKINLLPPGILRKKKLARKKLYFISSYVALFLIGWVLLVLGMRSYNFTVAKVNVVEPILKNYKPYVSKIEELKNIKREVTDKLKNIEGVLKQKSQLSEILLEVSKLTPSNTYITQISTAAGVSMTAGAGRGGTSMEADETGNRRVPTMVNERGEERFSDETDYDSSGQMQPQQAFEGGTTLSGSKISLIGITASYPMVGEYIDQLRTSPLFKTVELISVSSPEGGAEGRMMTPSRVELPGRRSRESVVDRSSVRTSPLGEETVKTGTVQFTLEITLGK